MSKARLARWAALRRTGCGVSVTSWMVPPVCRLAVLRTVTWCRWQHLVHAVAAPATQRRVSASSGMRDSPPVAAAPTALFLDQLGDRGHRRRR